MVRFCPGSFGRLGHSTDDAPDSRIRLAKLDIFHSDGNAECDVTIALVGLEKLQRDPITNVDVPSAIK